MSPPPAALQTARALDHLLSLQRESGCWEGEMVWCTMILSQYVIVQRIVGRAFEPATTRRIARHYEVSRTSDGLWGLHPESHGYVFTTTLAYVALRLLGYRPEHPLLARGRGWLREQPHGVLGIPTWGKFWLALIDLYGWDGVNPALPELFSLPSWLPFHPRRLYCHTRCIYTALAYLYGRRFTARLGPIADELRRELYAQPYETIDFAAYRHTVASTDLCARPGTALRLASDALRVYERHHLSTLRRRALDKCLESVRYEQRTSRYQALSPVNGLLNCLAIFAQGADDPDLRPSVAGLESWKWEDDERGLRYAGARSSTWDTAFAIQAILAAPHAGERHRDALRRAYRFLDGAQIVSEIADHRRAGRDPAQGGWCFSDGTHRWPVSDCTAEALAAILAVHTLPDGDVAPDERISDARLGQAAEFILRRQNPDGGFGTYERRRGPRWLEVVNPSEMFARCMTEQSYVECTGSALGALAHFRSAFPARLRVRVDRAIERGIRFLRQAQRPDGSFAGFWGINFTYAIFHVVRGLCASGVPSSDRTLARAAAWLVSAQRADGGWGEHFSSCLAGRYVEHPESQVVMTSWALLALLDVVGADAEPVARGVAWLRSRRRPDGSWPPEAVNGVFFGSAMLDYRLYRSYFPAWALARYGAARIQDPRGTPSAAMALKT